MPKFIPNAWVRVTVGVDDDIRLGHVGEVRAEDDQSGFCLVMFEVDQSEEFRCVHRNNMEGVDPEDEINSEWTLLDVVEAIGVCLQNHGSEVGVRNVDGRYTKGTGTVVFETGRGDEANKWAISSEGTIKPREE